MALSIAAADNATDPPSVHVTVGGAAGAAVSVFSQPVTLDGEATGWTLAGSMKSPQTAIDVEVTKGFWWFYASIAAGSVAGPVMVHATDGLDKPATRCRAAIAAVIALLGLTNPRDNTPLPIREQIYPDETDVSSFPCVILSNEGVQETDAGGVNAFDDRGFPTRVAICDRQGTPPDHSMLPTYERWRYAIERALDGQRLPGVPESAYCKVEPLVIFDPQLPMMQHIVSGLTVRSICRVPRGINV